MLLVLGVIFLDAILGSFDWAKANECLLSLWQAQIIGWTIDEVW